ncbi:MAG: GNAT family N-acetyltransferase [Sphingobacteriales bacterium]|nr:MAG: GNAT family N-acetyltransferase [Sphingobacteriales bacterium]
MPVFHQPWWLDATGLSWQVATVQNGDAVSGIWPYVPERRYGISFLQNPPLCPYLGPYVAFPDDLKESKQESFEHQTITALLNQLPPAQVVATALLPAIRQVGLFTQAGFKLNVRQTFLMDLNEITEAALLERLHTDYRRNLRKAASELVISNEPEAVDDLYSFQEATLARKGLKMQYQPSYLRRLLHASVAHGQGALWVARKAGVIQAMLWQVWDERCSYYLAGSKNPDVKDMRAMTALIFHAIDQSRIMGLEAFDFEGSMDPGVEHFFRHFGGRKALYLVLQRTDSLLWKFKNLIR